MNTTDIITLIGIMLSVAIVFGFSMYFTSVSQETKTRIQSWESTMTHLQRSTMLMEAMKKTASKSKHCEYCGREIELDYQGSCPGCAAMIE